MDQIPGERLGQSTLSLLSRAATGVATGDKVGLILVDYGGASIAGLMLTGTGPGNDNIAELTQTDPEMATDNRVEVTQTGPGTATAGNTAETDEDVIPLIHHASRHRKKSSQRQSDHASPDEGNSREQLELMKGDQINDDQEKTVRGQNRGSLSDPILIDSDEEDQQRMEDEDQQRMEDEDQPRVEDEDQQRMEDEDQQRMEDEDQQRVEQTEQTLSPANGKTVRFLQVQDISTSRQGGAASVNTATTRGGCTFEDLSRGILVNYACDHLVRIDGKSDEIGKAEEKMLNHVEDCIKEIELQSEKRVKKLYFGKTFIHRRKQGRGKFAKFDCMDHKTWKKTGISARWGSHKCREYAKNGMVVLAAIQKKSIPKKCRETRKDVHQEDYALALEQRLIQHYLFSEGDERLENKTLTAGGSDGKMSIAYALYMTFTLEDSPPPSPSLSPSLSLPPSPSPHQLYH